MGGALTLALLAITAPAANATARPNLNEASGSSPAPLERCGPVSGASVQKVRIGPGDGLWRVLKKAGFAAADIGGALTALEKLANLNMMPPGRELTLKSDADGRLLSLEQRPSPTISQCVERAAETSDHFQVRVLELAVETKVELVSGRIGRSLAATLEQLGEKTALAFLLHEIFAGSKKDPFAHSSPGDRFRVLVEKKLIDRDIVGYGEILAAEYIRATGQIFRAFYYEAKDGTAGYYAEDGKLLRRRALRIPVADAHLTSGFGVRAHPLNGKPQAHLGLDFAAPEWTEVYAAREGTVELNHSEGDLGNFVSIQHDGDLVTRYAHLRGFARGMKTGKWVKKGALLGYVGKTGLATGPHLHFETIVGGMHVDPQRFLGARGAPLEAEELSAFHVETSQLVQLFDAIDADAEAEADNTTGVVASTSAVR